MIKKPTRNRVSILAGLLLLGGAPSASAQYELDWWTVDGGGEMFSTGGGFELSSTIGQPDANTMVMTGGGFELVGGFWNTYVTIPCPCDLDGDRDIDLADLATLLASYGLCAGDPGFNPVADIDDSGCVDLGDLASLLAVYGTMCP